MGDVQTSVPPPAKIAAALSSPALALRSTAIRVHANVLGEEAREGRAGEAFLHRLLDRARKQLGVDAPLDRIIDVAASTWRADGWPAGAS